MKYLDYLRLYFDDEPSGDDGADNSGSGTNGAKGIDGAKHTEDKSGDDHQTPKYTDADLDKIIEKKLAKWKKQQAAAVDEATRLANMTAQERVEHERDKLKKELDDLKHANTMAEMEKTARKIFNQDGLNVPDDIISVIVDEDADKTNSRVKSFSKAVNKMIQDEVKRRLTHKTPSTGAASGQLTYEDIMKEPDYHKRQKLIRENMSVFRNGRNKI